MHECSAGASPVTRPGRRARELGGLPTPAFAGARGGRRLSTAQSRLIAIGRRSLCSIVDYFPSRTRHQLPWPVSETLPEHLEWAAVGVRTPGGQEGCSSCCRRSGILAKTSLSLPTNYAALLPLITCMLTKRKLPRRPSRVPGSPGRRRNRLRGQFLVVRRGPARRFGQQRKRTARASGYPSSFARLIFIAAQNTDTRTKRNAAISKDTRGGKK